MVSVYLTDIRQWKDEEIYHKWLANLPQDRRLRAESYKQVADQRRSLAGSILVCRAFAERYPDVDMSALRFVAGENGKPYIEQYPAFRFSISHSGDYAVCVVSEQEVGIDIQKIQDIRLGVAERFFSEEEKAQIEAAVLDKEEELSETALAKREKMFFRIWSAKEAYVKLTGEGLKEFTSFTADLKTGHIHCHEVENAKRIYVKEYEVIQDYVMTVCAREQKFGEVQTYTI